MRKRKLIRRMFTIWEEQDGRIGKLADELPDMDKSRIVRFLLSYGLATLETNAQFRKMLCDGIQVKAPSESEKVDAGIIEEIAA